MTTRKRREERRKSSSIKKRRVSKLVSVLRPFNRYGYIRDQGERKENEDDDDEKVKTKKGNIRTIAV